jgi:hypothetical protein
MVNAHLAEMAYDGWELVATTSTIVGDSSSSATKAFHFIWKRAQ